MERHNGDDDEVSRRYSSAPGDMHMERWWLPEINVNGHNDPVAFRAVLRLRELRRAGDGLCVTMHAKRPGIWVGLMNWLIHADTGQTTADATRTGVAEPTAERQI